MLLKTKDEVSKLFEELSSNGYYEQNFLSDDIVSYDIGYTKEFIVSTGSAYTITFEITKLKNYPISDDFCEYTPDVYKVNASIYPGFTVRPCKMSFDIPDYNNVITMVENIGEQFYGFCCKEGVINESEEYALSHGTDACTYYDDFMDSPEEQVETKN